MPKISQKIDASWNRYLKRSWWNLRRKLKASWYPNRPQIVVNFEPRFLTNHALPAVRALFFKIPGSKLRVKTNQELIKKWCQDGKACGHRFLNDFDRFWQAGMEKQPRSIKKREKKSILERLGGILGRIWGGPWRPRTVLVRQRRDLSSAGAGTQQPSLGFLGFVLNVIMHTLHISEERGS